MSSKVILYKIPQKYYEYNSKFDNFNVKIVYQNISGLHFQQKTLIKELQYEMKLLSMPSSILYHEFSAIDYTFLRLRGFSNSNIEQMNKIR